MLDCFLMRCLPRASWLVLWDHVLLCPPCGGLLAALAVVRLRRKQLLEGQEGVLLSPLKADAVCLIKAFHGLKDASQHVVWDLTLGPAEEASEAEPPAESEESAAESVEVVAWTDQEKELKKLLKWMGRWMSMDEHGCLEGVQVFGRCASSRNRWFYLIFRSSGPFRQRFCGVSSVPGHQEQFLSFRAAIRGECLWRQTWPWSDK